MIFNEENGLYKINTGDEFCIDAKQIFCHELIIGLYLTGCEHGFITVVTSGNYNIIYGKYVVQSIVIPRKHWWQLWLSKKPLSAVLLCLEA